MEMKITQAIFGILLALTKKRNYQNDMKSTLNGKGRTQVYTLPSSKVYHFKSDFGVMEEAMYRYFFK